ncbi:MAG: Spy/CpxP family protein refolding chaperone [Pseudomonadota bacterium]
MNTIRKSIIIGLTVLGLGAGSFAAQAQEARPAQERMHAKWGERAAMHQKKLHELLTLTPSQEAAWATYTAATTHEGHGQRGERGAWKALPAPARMEKRIEMAKQHIARMESHLAALNTFYAVLTPAQKKVFDDNSMGHGGRRMKHRRGA